MIGVVVTFRFGLNFDEQAVRKIAETARTRFVGMPGLRSKGFHFQLSKARGRELLRLGFRRCRQRSLLMNCLSV